MSVVIKDMIKQNSKENGLILNLAPDNSQLEALAIEICFICVCVFYIGSVCVVKFCVSSQSATLLTLKYNNQD